MQTDIQHAREVALEILKPSQKELEHGLELHETLWSWSPTDSLRIPLLTMTQYRRPSMQARRLLNCRRLFRIR